MTPGAAAATSVVVDTNVLVVAGGQHPEASDACQAACLSIVRGIHDGDVVVAVDSDGFIVSEYARQVRGLQGSGVADKLIVRLSRRFRDPAVCRQVELTPIDDPPGSYAEVPLLLRDFDVDDQPFIAVAAADESRPQLFTGVDGEWWLRQADFATCGMDVQFPCAGDLLEAPSG